ncbi:LexA family transcriptional regulator [Metapseudomonas resinovorans]|uniref:LexA family transcriptional regulator n=1 Tax=Metapseudomonas resinovorans TaxID=53412 RepID=UPI003D19C403
MSRSPKRELLDWERSECAALKAEIEAYNQARPRAEKITQEAAGDALGMTQGAFSSYLNGRLALNKEVAAGVARVFGIPVERFSPRLAREIEQFARAAEIHSNVSGDPMPVKTGSVPVVGKAMLGTAGYFEAIDYPVGHGEGFLNIFSSDPNAYGLRVVGNSMNPRIKNNEFVLIEPNREYVAGDEVLVKTTKGQAMIKEFIYYRDGQYRFDSVNADYDPIFIHEDEVEDVQYVGAIVKSSRFTPAS